MDSALKVVSFVLVVTLISCGDEAANKETRGEAVPAAVTYCADPNMKVTGLQFLDSKFMEGVAEIKTSAEAASTDGMILLEGGTYTMGGDRLTGFSEMPETGLPQPDEFPNHKVTVSDFYMDEHEVTVRQFKEFVDATGYKTVAEYDIDWEELKKQLPPGTPAPEPEVLKAGSMVFYLATPGASRDNPNNWWAFEQGVTWRNPDGKTTDITSILDHPVTQVSWYDAMAYAKWCGKRLPTEAEFEYAMRGGANGTMYPWGNEKVDEDFHPGNFLQGEFPYSNTVEDGFEFTAPVKSFPPNKVGLYDLGGNVWEWTHDWYSARYYKDLQDAGTAAVDPQGPAESFEVYNPNAINKVVRGGSFLCNDDWCSGYRNSRRMRLSPDSGMQHLGFRCVRSVEVDL